ncbi:MAG: hypothetical protein IAF94_24405 [Pirellulaceae bacterium]|nr:hypothetical protein [Pirellulaceae bacterium]
MLEAMGLRLWTPPMIQEPAAPVAAPPRMQKSAPVTPTASLSSIPADTATATATDARARHIATLDWPALRSEAEECRACSLCESRRQVVFGVGQLRARWMIVGEAPGEQEDLQGEPFVGAAGQRVDNMQRALGRTPAPEGAQAPEQRVYIANTLPRLLPLQPRRQQLLPLPLQLQPLRQPPPSPFPAIPFMERSSTKVRGRRRT